MTRRAFNETEFTILRDALKRLLEAKVNPVCTRTYRRRIGEFWSDTWNLYSDLSDDALYSAESERAHDPAELRKLLKQYARELHREGIIVTLDGKTLSLTLEKG